MPRRRSAPDTVIDRERSEASGDPPQAAAENMVDDRAGAAADARGGADTEEHHD
jgi:hypothetical protein